MKRLIAILLTLTLLLSLSACGNTSADTKPADTKPTETTAETKTETPAETTKKTKLDTVKESGKLIVGTTADYPPYEFHAMIDGKDTIVGFDMALAADIAKHLGVELEIQDMEFSAVLSGVETGLIDVGIAGIKSTAERDKTMDFSKIYRNSKNNYSATAKEREEGMYKACIASDIKYSRSMGPSTARPSPPRENGVLPEPFSWISHLFPSELICSPIKIALPSPSIARLPN